MNILDMLQRNITLSVTPKDLMQFVEALSMQSSVPPMAKQPAIATNEPEPKYLSAEDVMKRLRISRSTLWRWHKDGFLVHRKVGKYNRYAIEDIIKIEEGCHG